MDVVDDLSSFEMMYMPGKGFTGSNESMLDFNQQNLPHHHNHPAFNGESIGGHQNTNGTAIDDPGGNLDCIAHNPFLNVTIDQPTTALFQFVVNGLGISIVAVLGNQIINMNMTNKPSGKRRSLFWFVI